MSTDQGFDIAGNGGYTNTDLKQVSGTFTSPSGADRATVQLLVNGQLEMASAFQTATGTWYAYAPLSNGLNTVAAVETVGGTQQTTRTVTYDVVTGLPDVEFTSYTQSTDKALQTLTGTVTSVGGAGVVAGQVLTIADNGTRIAQTTVQPDGTWSTQATLLQLGLNRLTATMTDAAGNTGEGDANDTYTVTPPTVALSGTGSLTNQPQQLIGGSASSGDTIALLDNGTLIDAFTVNASGTWIRKETLAVQGANAIQAVDTSPAGNVGKSDTVSYTLDTLPPAVAITSASTSKRAAADTETVTGTAEVGSSVVLLQDGNPIAGATVGADGTWSAQVALHAGPNGLSAQATDAAGNVGTSNTVVDTLDTTPATPTVVAAPTTPAVQPAPSVSITSAGGLTDQPAATVSGQAAPNSTVTLYDGGTAVTSATAAADGSWALALTLGQGVNILTATDTTAAGTVGGNSIADILDTTPPSVDFGAAPQFSGTTAALTGFASDASGIRGIEVFDGATDLGAAQVNGDGSWTFTHDFGQGSYDHLAAVATDAAGNSATASALYDLHTGVPGVHSVGTTTIKDASGAVTSVTTTAADGAIGAQTVSNGDGTATSTGYENGQALFSIGNDVMTGTGYRENFVFQPTMGHARITDFVVAGGGHDTITLSHQDFDNVAQVLANTTMNHGSAVIHVSPDDTIRLAGVTKAQLAQHRGDFAFTS